MVKEIYQHWICCYDIRHVKRLAKVHQILANLGIAINYSVFYLYLTIPQFEGLCQVLKKIIHKDDDVRLYVCESLVTAKYIGEMSPGCNRLINATGLFIRD